MFHICDEGRKISFLCPNGTIFRQLDLICDWWFKVDCASSPSQYAESSETLARDQSRRLQQRKHLAAEFNVESLSGEPLKQIDRRMGKAFVEKNRRMDAYFNEPNPDSIESFEFVDVGHSKRPQNTARVHYTAKIRMPSKRTFETVSSSASKELQEVAESASFVKPRQLLNGYNYPVPTANGKPAGYEYPKPEKQIISGSSSAANPTDRTGKRLESAKPTGFGFDPANSNNNAFEPKPFNTRPTETLSTTPQPKAVSFESRNNGQRTSTTSTTSTPPTTQYTRGSTTYQSSLERERQEKSVQQFTTTSQTTPKSTTAVPKTYSTAKKLTSKAKEGSFYTPTIPTITNKATKEITTERTPKSQTTTPTPSVSEHALEMMKTLQQLGEMEATTDSEKYQGQRPGLEVPPSSGPSALHSLALYFATTPVETNSTEPTPNDEQFQGKTNSDFELSTEANTPAITSAHLSQRTVEQYQALFEAENKRLEPNNTKINDRFHDDNDLDAENSRNPIYAAAGSPQIRELAQVFTHALSAYLQDPETFRKILSEIRPTEPPPLESNEIENRFNNQDVFHGQEASYAIPKTATTSTTSTVSPTEDFEVLDFSDVTISTQRQATTTTTTESPQTTTRINVPVPVSRILPPFSNNAIDRTPGSDLIVETLENEASNFFNRQGKSNDNFETTTDANPLAIEINGGLALSTTFPFNSDESQNKDVSTQTESNYFPAEKSKNKKVASNSPYGKGVKPSGSAPLTKLENQDLPEQWGDEGTTTVFDTEATPTISPDLLPPFKATTVVFPPSKYYEPPHNENEESLQRSQSQSIFGNNGNSVKNSEKRGKSYFNYVTVHDESSTVQTTRFGDRIQSTTELPDTTTYSSTNNVNSRGHFITRKITTLDDSGSTPLPDLLKTTIPDTGKISPNSKTTVSYSIFLDPLTINDGLMESSEDAKKANNKATYLPRDLTTEGYTEAVTSSPAYTVSTRTASVSTRRGKELNVSPTATYNRVESPEPEKDQSEVDFVTAMQRRANEMFGGLNDTQADHLMNVMKQADKNKNVRRLILLLIQTCDDDYNKTVEESRNALLNALIQMDTKDFTSDIQVVKTRYGGHDDRRSRNEALITEATPAITTYRSANHNKYTSAEATVEYSYVTSTSVSDPTTTTQIGDSETTTNTYPTSYSETTEQTTTTDFPVTSTTDYPTTFFSSTTTTTTPAPPPSTTSRKPRTRTRTRVSSRVQKSLGLSEDFVAESSSNYGTDNAQNKHSDARALELLRSLYSLASRWG